MIGGALVIFTDLFILDKNQTLINKIISNDTSESVEYTRIKTRHNSYMNDGIDIDSEILSVANVIRPPEIKNDTVEIIDMTDGGGNHDAASLANISPALGIERDDEDLERFFKKKPLVDKSKYQDDKNVSDVIHDLDSSNEDMSVVYSVGEIPINDDDDIDVTENSIATEYSSPKGSGMVVIIIDDMGITLRSKLVEVLPGPLTLSYLPYAKGLDDRVNRAVGNGHEVMLHMPMEPMNGSLDGGPQVLKTSQKHDEFKKTLDWGLSSFDGFVGLNNHMGSRLTQDEKSMRRVMNHIKNTGLYFIDSKTIGSSVVESVAQEVGVPYAVRDVFLDHEISDEFVKSALAKLEKKAHSQGYAIAIGHPHKETIAALKEWLPTLKEKGLTLVPASKVIKHPVGARGDIALID